MTENPLLGARSQLLDGDRLEVHHTGGGCTAWRLTEPDAPGLFAPVTDEGGTAIPIEPDTVNLIIGICDVQLDDPLMVLETDGRQGLCRWYVATIGHNPVEEPGGPRPIRQLIEDVATHLLLRCAEPADVSRPGLDKS